MKKFLLFTLWIFLFTHLLQAQVTRINNNSSLQPITPLNSNLAIALSGVDQTLWVTDGTAAGTFQLSNTIKDTGAGVVLNGKYIFAGSTTATGQEIFITDGTIAGTKIISDIVTGATGSNPDNNMTVLNGFVYFTAATAAEGRELWRTDGTPGNTAIVKDIIAGPTSSNDPDKYELISTGTYLLFDVKTTAEGNELWWSNGTIGNASSLKNLITGPMSSDPRTFFRFNNVILFSATSADGTHGEVWRTDGTSGGTILLKNNITGGFFGFLPFNALFHVFNNRAYFLINDGVNAAGIWSTDGIDATAAHTSFLKDVGGTADINALLFIDAFNLPGKFIFPVADFDIGSGDITRGDLWESDGTTAAGTKLFKSFPLNANNTPPAIFVNIGLNTTNQTITYPLYNGNFFFSANSTAEGNELWLTNGDPSAATTHLVRDINTGNGDGVTIAGSYFYSTAGLYFAATNGVQGNELWKSDGTTTGTTIVKDINPNAAVNTGDSDPSLDFIVNGRIMFTATDGDHATNTDLFVVDGIFNPLPIKLLDFTVLPKSADAILNWRTSQEINSKDYTVQRSFDGRTFESVGTVAASGTSATGKAYSFIDAGIINSGKSIIYYRLVTTDIDGKSAYSPVITLKLTGTGKWNVKLLSNPVSENIKVVLSGITENVQFSVMDLNGKKIYTKQLAAVNGQISLPTDHLPRGVYTLITETLKERKAIQFVK
jgi:ELWxxDGT repeat protein